MFLHIALSDFSNLEREHATFIERESDECMQLSDVLRKKMKVKKGERRSVTAKTTLPESAWFRRENEKGDNVLSRHLLLTYWKYVLTLKAAHVATTVMLSQFSAYVMPRLNCWLPSSQLAKQVTSLSHFRNASDRQS